MGELLIVTGPPGSGKSVVASRLVGQRDPSALVEGDEFFRFLSRGRVDPWLVEASSQNEVVTEAAGAATGRLVHGGYWTVYDGVLGWWFLPRFMAAAGLERAHYLVLLPPVTSCVERVARRLGHGFTDESATRRVHAAFAAAGAARSHLLTDPALGVDEVVRLVLQRLGTDQLAVEVEGAGAPLRA